VLHDCNVVEPHCSFPHNQVKLIIALTLQATKELVVAKVGAAVRVSLLRASRLGVITPTVHSKQVKAIVECLLGLLLVDGKERGNIRLHELVLLLVKGQHEVVL
jgi:hypothetical protein